MMNSAPRAALCALLLLSLTGCCCPSAPSPCTARAPSTPDAPTVATRDARQVFVDVTTLRIPQERVADVLGALKPTSPNDPTILTEAESKKLMAAAANNVAVHVLQSPKLLALEGQEATIFIGETIHFARTEAKKARGGLEFKTTEDAKSPVFVGYQLKLVATPDETGETIAIDMHELARQPLEEYSQDEITRMGAEAFLRTVIVEQRLDSSFKTTDGGRVLLSNPVVYEDKSGRYVRVSLLHVQLVP